MSNVFEELMTQNRQLTESTVRSRKSTKSTKISASKVKVESLKIFEEKDLDELDTEFAVTPEEVEDTTSDEVVLIIDPELPADEEAGEDAVDNLIGSTVYKCPVCGANYACDCESSETDEEGTPTECPVCGDDEDQVFIGEIVPSTEFDASAEEDQEEDEEVEDSIEDTEEISEEEEEGTLEEGVRVFSVAYGDNSDDDNVVDYEANSALDAIHRFKNQYPNEKIISVYDDSDIYYDIISGEELKESIDSESEVAKYQKWVDFDMKHYGRVSNRTKMITKKAGFDIVKDDFGDYEVVAGVTEEVTPEYIDDKKFNVLMNDMLDENYKGAPVFKINTARITHNNKIKLEYTVRCGRHSGRGTLVSESTDFSGKSVVLKFKDQGVFTESFSTKPIIEVKCAIRGQSIIPTNLTYDYTKRINESVYRVYGTTSKKIIEDVQEDSKVLQVTFDVEVPNSTDLSVQAMSGNTEFYSRLDKFLQSQGYSLAGDIINTEDVTEMYM